MDKTFKVLARAPERQIEDLQAILDHAKQEKKKLPKAERKRIKKALKERRKLVKNLYAREAANMKLGQTYLFQAYSRKWRFFKILNMFEKFALVAIALFVPFATQQWVKLLIGDGLLILTSFLATHPFGEWAENFMDRFSRLTNVINISVAMALPLAIPDAVSSFVMIVMNCANLVVTVLVVLAGPIRGWLEQRRAHKALMRGVGDVLGRATRNQQVQDAAAAAATAAAATADAADAAVDAAAPAAAAAAGVAVDVGRGVGAAVEDAADAAVAAAPGVAATVADGAEAAAAATAQV